MSERKSAGVLFEPAGDRGASLAGLGMAAVSGCSMGFVIEGRVGVAAIIAGLAPVMGLVGWWLRGAAHGSGLYRE